jgi:hypothetical protein
LTVIDKGSPMRRGCSTTARSSVAAVVPPNGPVKFQNASLVRPASRPSPLASRRVASSKGCAAAVSVRRTVPWDCERLA